MIEITLKISDKENGTPATVLELIHKAIRGIGESEDKSMSRFHIVTAEAKRV